MKIAKEIALWIVTVLLALLFVNAGVRKFFEHGGWTTMFRHAGFPDWFRILIGVVETAAAALLLLPRTAAYGAATIIVVMLGAIGTALVTMHGANALRGTIAPLVWMLVAVIVLAARWRQRAALTRARPLVPQQ